MVSLAEAERVPGPAARTWGGRGGLAKYKIPPDYNPQ